MKLFNKNNNIIKSRRLTKARFLYLYVIFGSISGFFYFALSLFMGWPKIFSLTPIFLLFGFIVSWFFIKNCIEIWFYVTGIERGKLLLYLNKSTHWDKSQKIKVSKWIYPGKRRIRKEAHSKLSKKVMDGEELTKDEKKLYRYKSVFCPQQLRLGFNEALLVNALIHAHRNILPLDDEVREIMNLTDTNILNFDIMSEYKKAGGKEYDRLVEIGRRKSEELNK